VGVNPTPDVVVHEIEPTDHFLILASDGVWEFIESDEAVRIVGAIYAKGWSAEAACKHLIARAAVEWMQEEGDYRDDITCIVVYLSCREEMKLERWGDYGYDDDKTPEPSPPGTPPAERAVPSARAPSESAWQQQPIAAR
jgi:serine/threonine protein phosphatase PrpC